MKENPLVKHFILASLLLVLIGNCYLIAIAPTVQGELVQNNLIVTMISKINETEIYNTVNRLQNFTTRLYGSSGNVDAATYLYNRLSNIPQLSVEYQGIYSNIIATLPGVDTESNVTYIVGAHYDSISSTSYAPGATDNGGGVAIVLEFARIMSQYSFNHTLKFAFWNAEEVGLLGSKEYVRQAYDNKIEVSLYLNFDSSCYDPYGRMVLDIMFNQQSSWISEMMTEYNTLYGINFDLTYNVHSCGSDHTPFWTYGYTSVMTHSESHAPETHTSEDTIDKISTIYAKKNGQLGMSVLASLAEVQNPSPTPTPAPTPTPTPTPAPTPTPTPTPTPQPTTSAMSTPTPAPTLSPSPSTFFPQEVFYAAAVTGAASIIALTILAHKSPKQKKKSANA